MVGPTFHFDVDGIDFGTISYDFAVERKFRLFNTSDIGMTYKLRVPQDGKFQKQEFVVTPNEGTLSAGETEDIQLVLCSTTVKEYEVFLTVDVEGVGEGLLSIPVIANCQPPDVRLKNEELKFGNCFIRYNYEHEICLVNSSDQMCRFKIMEQDEQSKAVATFEVESYEGVIAANSELIIPVKMRCEKLGNITLPVYVTIAGVKKPVRVSSQPLYLNSSLQFSLTLSL